MLSIDRTAIGFGYRAGMPKSPAKRPQDLSDEIARQDDFTKLTLLVFRIHGLLLEAGDRLAAPVGQTSARWQVMGVVDHGPTTVAAVARTMGLARQSVQRTTDRLAEEGLLAYVDNPADRRAQHVTLTSKGRKALKTIEVAQAEWSRTVTKRIGAVTLSRSLEDLEKLEALLRGQGVPSA